MYYYYYSNQGDFEYTKLCIFEYTNLCIFARRLKNFCASRHINVTLIRSATECAQSVSGIPWFRETVYLFIYFIHDIVYPYTTRGWKILDYSTCCRKHHSIYDLVMLPGNTSRIIENFQSSRCNGPSNKFIFRAINGNSIVCNIFPA
jgi:hypothetical protein